MVAARCWQRAAPRAVIASPSELPATGLPVVRADFRPEYRLHTPADYAQVFAYRRVLKGRWFNLHYRPNGLDTARLGFVVARKLARRAVLRNLLKRIARDVFRRRRDTLPPVDVVLRLAAGPGEATRMALRAEFESLLDRIPRRQVPA